MTHTHTQLHTPRLSQPYPWGFSIGLVFLEYALGGPRPYSHTHIHGAFSREMSIHTLIYGVGTYGSGQPEIFTLTDSGQSLTQTAYDRMLRGSLPEVLCALSVCMCTSL